MPDAAPSQEEYFKLVRAAIEHEDNLVNQRLTWLLTTHGFLLALFSALQPVIISNLYKLHDYIHLIEAYLGFVVVIAAFISLVVGRTVTCANLHIDHLSQWWMQKYPDQFQERLSLGDWGRSTFGFEYRRMLPKQRYYTEDRASTTTYPPICGMFHAFWLSRVVAIPYILAFLDIVMMLACLWISKYLPR